MIMPNVGAVREPPLRIIELMKYNPDIHHRKSIRLKHYDYAETGAYFVTICTKDRECLFGEIVNGEMRLNNAGEIVQNTWNDLINHVSNIVLDQFIIMPNHIHCIVGAGSKPALHLQSDNAIDNIFQNKETGQSKRAGLEPAPTSICGLSEIVRQFKTFSARRINKLRKMSGISIWQRNYYEHIIRDETQLNHIREYIITNPTRWDADHENPDCSTATVKPSIDFDHENRATHRVAPTKPCGQGVI